MSNNIYAFQTALSDLDKIKNGYLDYLNTGNLIYWEGIEFPLAFFIINLALWVDKNTYPLKTKHFSTLCEIHDSWVAGLKSPPNDSEEFLNKISFFKKEYLKLFYEEARRYDWSDPSVEYLIKVTGYNPEIKRKTFPEEIRETLKFLRLT